MSGEQTATVPPFPVSARALATFSCSFFINSDCPRARPAVENRSDYFWTFFSPRPVFEMFWIIYQQQIFKQPMGSNGCELVDFQPRISPCVQPILGPSALLAHPTGDCTPSSSPPLKNDHGKVWEEWFQSSLLKPIYQTATINSTSASNQYERLHTVVEKKHRFISRDFTSFSVASFLAMFRRRWSCWNCKGLGPPKKSLCPPCFLRRPCAWPFWFAPRMGGLFEQPSWTKFQEHVQYLTAINMA